MREFLFETEIEILLNTDSNLVCIVSKYCEERLVFFFRSNSISSCVNVSPLDLRPDPGSYPVSSLNVLTSLFIRSAIFWLVNPISDIATLCAAVGVPTGVFATFLFGSY
jgi:hypothetical protein